MKRIKKEQIKKYFSAKDAKNSILLENAFADPANERILVNIFSEQWNEINANKSLTEINLKHLLHKLHYHINTDSANTKISRSSKLVLWYKKFAAILLIPLIVGGSLLLITQNKFENSWSEVKAPKGEKAQFILPDGSKGYLNSGTTIRYKSNFKNERFLHLDGEAFFDVRKNRNNPFRIQTSDLHVTVLGTKFNVCAYNDEKSIQTTLESGSVKINLIKSNKFLILKPGQQNIYNRDTQVSSTIKVNTDLYTAWKDNKLRFDNASFNEIVKKMERWYDVKINLDDELRYTQRYTMTVKTESLKEMLDLLSVTTPINYKIDNENVFISLKR